MANDIDVPDRSPELTVQDACGQALAQTHALSDDLGRVGYEVEPSIVAACPPRELFVKDLLSFTVETADQLRRDHIDFIEDLGPGAFDTIDMDYR